MRNDAMAPLAPAAGARQPWRGLCAVGIALAAANCSEDHGAREQATNAPGVARELRRADDNATALLKEAGGILARIGEMEESNKVSRHTLYHNLGCVYRQAGRFAEAESAFLEALRLDPAAADTHLGLGMLYDADLRQPDKACACFDRFLELSPDSPHAAEVRGWVGRLRKQDKTRGAVR
jgi:tetratricopeptide (TPR) repeat protein